MRLVLCFLVGLAACGDDGTSPESVAGTYILQTIDGKSVPPSGVIGATGPVEHTAGSLTLNQDMTCSFSLTSRTKVNDVEVTTGTITEACTYAFRTGTLTVTFLTFPEDEDTFSGSITGSSLVLIIEGTLWVFQK